MSVRIDSLFSIGEIKPVSCEPTLYNCGELPEPLYKCSYNGSEFKISVFGRTVELPATSEFIRKIRHEVVSDVLRFQSDEPLSSIGVVGEESALSPDFINLASKTVIELGTSAISELFALRRTFGGKMVKYSYLVNPKGFDMCVIVVSPSRIYSNLILPQDVVDSLCYRMRIGLALESVISETLGNDIFSEDLSHDEAVVKDVLRGFNLMPEKTEDFDTDTILAIGEDPSQDDFLETGSILRDCLNKSMKKSTNSSEDLNKYMMSFSNTSKMSDKRVSNIPMMYLDDLDYKDDLYLDEEYATDMPRYLKKIWSSSCSAAIDTTDVNELLDEAMSKKEYHKHRVQRLSAFNVSTLNYEEKIEAAKAGLWAKSMKDVEELTAKEIEDRKSFHPSLTETTDISSFIKQNLINERVHSSLMPRSIKKLMDSAKQLWSSRGSLSMEILNQLLHTKLSKFGQTVSNVMTEICYCYKYWIKRSDFYHKIVDGIHMLVRCTGDHIFAAFAYPKRNTTVIETGRIGPKIYESRNYYFTDVCSYNEPTIEHFVKTGPYIISILSHLISHFEMDLKSIHLESELLSETINTILLVFLTNKTDCEELVTSQRYLTMGVLEDVDPNPWRFVERLPEVIRSRMTCFLLKRTIEHMYYYSSKKVMKVPNKNNLDFDIEYIGLRSLFGDYEPTIRQKVNEFYFGYVVSKERGRGSDRNFKIMKKIVAEEYRFRDTVKETFSESREPKIHVSNSRVVRTFVYLFKNILQKILGPDYEKVIKTEIIRNLAKCSFEDLATLKVSSRTYQEKINVPAVNPNMKTRDIRTMYETSNPDEKTKRPRVMEAISTLVAEYEKVRGKKIKHPIELVPYCINDIEVRGYWDSDIFPKSQHGGDREIHVLEVKMRVLQYFVESISKTLCRMVPSDTLTHPYEKESFVKKHYRDSARAFGTEYFTLGKSADATKWCQRNDSTKFAAIVTPFLPPGVKEYFMIVMKLWKHKRISFPIQFAANFQSNRLIKSNKIYERMRDEFFSGSGIFSQPQSNKMTIKSGMMQGILHYTSSFTHALIQEVCRKLQTDFLAKRGIQSHITIVQGSDDSAEILTLRGHPSSSRVRLATTMLNWKEYIAEHFSIYTSRAKSAIGCLDLVEYNSEWMVRSNVIKPTFRWVSACLETNVTERFIDRVRMNYNVSSQVLEGGGKVLEVAMVQLCQAWMHYLLMGFHRSRVSDQVAHLLERLKDPALGFYPLDSDYIAGITGVEFQIYKLFKATSYGAGLSYSNIHEPNLKIDFNEMDDPSVGKALRSVKIEFSNMRLWQSQVRRMGIPDLEKLIQDVEENPYLIYVLHKSWSEAKYSVFLKMFQPGVKESISSHSAASRIMSASAYMFIRPCVTMNVSGKLKKLSLFKALIYQGLENEGKTKLEIGKVFTHAAEYAELESYVEDLEHNSNLVKTVMRTRNKQKICVFEKSVDDIPIIDLCKKRWFGVGKLSLSRRQLDSHWEEAKLKYPFLKDRRADTKEYLDMNEVELKAFLESLTTKPRHIVLLDTSAKSGSLLNSITRIFWSGVKIVLPGRSDDEESSFSVRSKVFSVLTSVYTDTIKKRKIAEILSKSGILDKIRVPARLRKLKVIKRWLDGMDKSRLVHYISEENLGTVGFFTNRQSGFGRDRKGLGEWRGRCADVSVKILMKGNTLQTITVNKLTDLRNLGQSLLDLVTSFNLDPPKTGPEYDYWLSPSGRIIGGFGKYNSFPIVLEPDLNVDIIDRLSEYSWTWNVSDCRIRLQAECGPNNRITLISEGLSCKDWDPEFVIEDDVFLKHWSEGSPIPLDIIEEELNSGMKFTPGDLLRASRKKHEVNTMSGWNLNSFLTVLKKSLLKAEEIVEVHEDESNYDRDFDIDFDDLLNKINMDESKGRDWSAMVEYEEEPSAEDNIFEMDFEYTEEFEAQLNLFLVVPEEEDYLADDKNHMPRTNMAFINLNYLATSQLGERDLSSAVRRFKNEPQAVTVGLLGVILSLICGRVCLKPQSGSEIIRQMETETSRLSVLSADDSNNEDLDPDEIQKRIDFYKGNLNSCLFSERRLYKGMISMLEDLQETSRMRRSSSKDIDSLKLSEVITGLRDYLIEEGKIPESCKYLVPRAFLPFLRAELDLELDNRLESGDITHQQHSIFREAVSKPYMSTLFLDALTMKYDISIKCCDYETQGMDGLYEFQ
nr:RNA-dependent RNA polymerase [blackberry line pattern virus]